ncbi:MAG: hypothetical protein U9N44_01730 [Chloroflexota bacterium]|nr:hypothetical protein [Chloroflexota bacterium]
MNTNGEGKRCGYCKGSGRTKKSEMDFAVVSCPICRGSGIVYVPGNYTICIECGGRGKKAAGYAMSGAATCETCEGKGWAKVASASNNNKKKNG